MINDTPAYKKNTRVTAKDAKPASKATYDGGFHVTTAKKREKSTASKRSTCQSFTFGYRTLTGY